MYSLSLNNTIRKVAILLTCHNRREKTLECIRSVLVSKENCIHTINLDIYLTDDGSSDGTGLLVQQEFPFIHVLFGDGNLFWAGGMRNSWKEALKKKYDAFLLLNDDTVIDIDCFNELLKTHNYSITKFGKEGIYIGAVINPQTQNFSYGGHLILSNWSFKTQRIIPNGRINECHLGNANIMFVCSSVVDRLGILSEKYIHGKADYDYTLRALEQSIPVLTCSIYCGYCINDHLEVDLSNLKFSERLKYLKSPKGIELKGYMYFIRRFFPWWRAPLVFISLWIKTMIPRSSKVVDLIMKR